MNDYLNGDDENGTMGAEISDPRTASTVGGLDDLARRSSVQDNTRPITRRVRFEVLRRDGHTCRYCGAAAPDVPLTVDHVIPRALGGSDDPSNLVTACQPCNAGKGSTSPDEHVVAEVDAASLLFAKAMERAAELRRGDTAVIDAQVAKFDAEWNRWFYTDSDGVKHKVERDKGWQDSIARFLSLSLDVDDLIKFVRVAMNTKVSAYETWRYFCGCCWHEITDRQELARRLIEDGAV